MLIQCPECDLQVSDKANTCPHCGYPLKPDAKPKSSRKPNKRRRLPNGFGQISEIKGRNLRNPFRAMVTVGKDKNGKPICKPLKPESYFPTYNDAYTALVEFNKNPYHSQGTVRQMDTGIFQDSEERRQRQSYYIGLAILLCCLRYASHGCSSKAHKRLHGRRCCYRKRPRADTKRINEE